MAGVNLNDYRNDAGEWLVGPEQIKADMAWEPDPYDDPDFYGWRDDYEEPWDICDECATDFDGYTPCDCGADGGWLNSESDYIREDFGYFGEMGLRD